MTMGVVSKCKSIGQEDPRWCKVRARIYNPVTSLYCYVKADALWWKPSDTASIQHSYYCPQTTRAEVVLKLAAIAHITTFLFFCCTSAGICSTSPL